MGSSPAILQSLSSHFDEIWPHLPTFLTVALAAVIPIYTGAHASLSRPSTAAKPKKKNRRKGQSRSADKRMEGLTPIDALLYPLGTGAMLTGLYYLIKWLQDPEILNKILNYYLTIFGLFAIWQLVRDLSLVTISFIFPTRYSYRSKTWTVDHTRMRFVAGGHPEKKGVASNISLLPGRLAQLSLPAKLNSILWKARTMFTRPYAVIDIFVKDSGSNVIHINESSIVAAVVALSTVLYYNLVDRPWWLTNLFGFSFCYSALQLLSPTTFWTGTLILTSLFFYDIYFVFYTPMMIEVATKLDIPAKLLIPKLSDGSESSEGRALTLLGLGDIVLPGIMLGLALRFDLYMHYLRKQRYNTKDANIDADQPTEALSKANSTTKAEYVTATGNWGERFWLDTEARKTEGGSFSKVYFNTGMAGYVIGLLVTEVVMTITKHGQPALLYLVPSVLGSLWTTAALRGELNYMWDYTEDEETTSSKKKAGSDDDDKDTTRRAVIAQSTSTDKTQEPNHLDTSNATGDKKDQPSDHDHSEASSIRKTEPTDESTPKHDKTLFYISINLPEDSEVELESQASEDSKK